MNGNSPAHLEYFLQMIRDGKHFGIIRPSDGEYHVISNTSLTNVDNWTFTAGGALQKDLLEAVKSNQTNLYIGIPCNHCNRGIYNTYKFLLNVPKDQITYANLFCNINWKPFLTFLKSYTPGFSVVTCGTTETNEFPIRERYIIDEFLVNKWDTLREQETGRLKEWVSTKKGELILFGAGPLAKVWIPMLMEAYPENIYLDIGSVLDKFLKGSTNRYYAFDDNNGFTTTICDFSIE